MRSIYDNVVAVIASAIQSLTGTTASTPTDIDTLGYNTAMVHVRTEIASGSPTTATAAWALLECATIGGSYTAALDNTGTAIGGTLNAKTVAQDAYARVEGLGTNRKRFLQIVITPAFSGGTSPAILSFGELIMGRAFTKPVNTGVSNT